MGEDGANEDRPQRSLDLDALEVPAFTAQEPWVFGAEGGDAEGRGRNGGHGRHGPIAGGEWNDANDPSTHRRNVSGPAAVHGGGGRGQRRHRRGTGRGGGDQIRPGEDRSQRSLGVHVLPRWEDLVPGTG